MSFTSAFLKGFADTSMEMNRRAQEQKQFEQTLAVQQAAVQMQQSRFDQEMQLKESERQDRLEQNQVENRISAFKATTEGALAQSTMETRKEGLAQKEQTAKATLAEKYAALRNDPKLLALQQKLANQKQWGVDTSGVEQELMRRKQELTPTPEEEATAGPLTGQAIERAPKEAQAAPEAAPEALGGQGQAAAPAPPGEAPETPAAAPPTTPAPAAAAASPPAQGGAPLPPASQSGGPLREVPADNPQEEERMNKFFKENDIPAVAISPQSKAKTKREEAENRFKTAVAEGQVAGMPEQKGAIEDLFRQGGVDVDVEAHQKGTQVKSRRAGGHLGGVVMSSGISFGGTESRSEQTLPTIDLFPKTKASALSGAYGAINRYVTGEAGNEDKSLGTTMAMTNALYNGMQRGVKVSQPYVGAMKDVVRDRIDDQIGAYKSKPEIQVGAFTSVLDPEKYRAASAAIALTGLDQKLGQMSKANGVDYDSLAVPKVVDADTSPKEVLGAFDKTVDKIGVDYPNMKPNRAEGQVISELTTRLQGKDLSPEERAQAGQMLAKIQKSTQVSDRFKKQASDLLTPYTTQPAEAKTPAKPGKPTSALEEGSRQQAAGKMVASAENVTAANKALGTVAPSTPDKNAAAKTAVTTVKTNYKAMTEEEKKKAQEAWKARRDTPAWKAVDEATRKNMNEAVGLARNNGFTA